MKAKKIMLYISSNFRFILKQLIKKILYIGITKVDDFLE